MPFKVAARTILQLGAELISSDGIAFYELIKNAFDAGSPDVEIDVVVRISPTILAEHIRMLREESEKPRRKKEAEAAIVHWKTTLADSVDSSAPGREQLLEAIAATNSLSGLIDAAQAANYIDINDTGSGMSAKDLESVYLTIGTPNRQQQKLAQHKRLQGAQTGTSKERPILGEKGVGRLAAMRLGMRLRVETTQIDDAQWNLLEINWNDFAKDLDANLEDIAVHTVAGPLKANRSQQGTRLRISELQSAWTKEYLREIAAEDISKMSDPFAKGRFPVELAFNHDPIQVPRLDQMLFDHAQARCEGRFIVDGVASRLEGTIDYTLRGEKTAFLLDGEDMLSATEASSLQAVNAIGPFSVKFYWYNRQTLRQLEGTGNLQEVIKLQERWAGGLMVYRDGFRVNPYGSGDDDWLTLDPIAFRSQGYKVNRRQIVGKIDISSAANPSLVDQTNREGLRDCPEKHLLVKLLQNLLLDTFKPFLEQCDEAAASPPLTARDIDKRVGREEKRLRQTLKLLKRDYPQVEHDTHIISTIEESVERIRTLMSQARDQVASFKKARDKVLHLAATGLLVEILAHELNRASRHTLSSLHELQRRELNPDVAAMFSTLEAQLKTLQKRLRILDPLGQAGRQVKETFDLIKWIEEIVSSHHDQFRRHHIAVNVEVIPARPAGGTPVTMVKGMLVQVLENLLSNSVHWLKQKSKLQPRFQPRITIAIDVTNKTVSVTDNGPGVDPARREAIFQPYVTTKPAGKGKGLGLFIAREIAKYHYATLKMSDHSASPDGHLNTFVFSLGETSR